MAKLALFGDTGYSVRLFTEAISPVPRRFSVKEKDLGLD